MRAGRAAVLAGAWGAPTAVVDGAHAGCVERRTAEYILDYDRRPPVPRCEFDGRVSLAAHRGRLWAYVRANMNPRGGGRYVQATSRPLAGGDWGAFSLVEMAGYDDRAIREFNIYFFAVNPNPVDATSLLALFPIVTDVAAFVGLAVSCDGRRFSAPHAFLPTAYAYENRTADQPVDGLLRRGNDVFVYVHENVPGLAPSRKNRLDPTDSRIARHTVDADKLAAWTADAKRGLAGCD